MTPLSPVIKEKWRGGLERDTATLVLGWGARLGVQTAYFVLVARGLGAGAYGAFSTTLAVVALVSPLASLGATSLVIREGTRDPALLATWWANARLVTLAVGVPLSVLLGAGAWLVTGALSSAALVLAVAASELVLVRAVEVAGAVEMVRGRVSATAFFPVWVQVARLGSAVVLVVSPLRAGAGLWGALYLAGTLPAALVLVVRTQRSLGRSRRDLRLVRRHLGQGLLFSLGLSAQSCYNDIDKVMLARLGTLDAVGAYAAAYRFVDMAFAPLRGLFSAAYPRFFRAGQGGLRSALPLTRRVGGRALLLGAAGSLGLVALARVVPLLLGPSYAAAAPAITGLALLPLLKAGHYLAADTLTGSGHQGVRTGAQVTTAVVNVVLNLLLMPTYGLTGAVVASVLTDAFLCLTLWGAVAALLRRSRVALPATAAAAA